MATPPKRASTPRGPQALAAPLLQQLLAAAPVGIIFVDPQLRIEFANPAAAALLAQNTEKSMIGVSLPDLVPGSPGIPEQAVHCMQSGDSACANHSPFDPARPGGNLRVSTRPVRSRRGETAGVAICLEEIFPIRDIALDFRHSRGFEAVSILTGGIARDFSNILWEVMSNVELAAAEVEVGHPARYNLEQAESACRSAQEMVMRIVRFGGRSGRQRTPLHLSRLVDESLQELADELPETVRVEHHRSTDRDLVLAEPSEIKQMLVQLYRNALQAMAESGGGRLEVSIVDVELRAEELADRSEMLPGRYVILTIMDSGPGIQPDLAEHVFEPFFSTKPRGRHTGLGLAIVNAIVRRHAGTVSMDSRPGRGTVVHVILPTLRKSERAAPDSAPPAAGG